MFIAFANRDNAALNVAPYGGGFLDQPFKTMQAIELIQDEFSIKLQEEIKKSSR